jgi:hypothetical protein
MHDTLKTEILTACSDAPIYLFSNSGPFTEINRNEQAAAAAPTMWVFPHPGGPYNKTPDLNLKGASANIFENLIGNSSICLQKKKDNATFGYGNINHL